MSLKPEKMSQQESTVRGVENIDDSMVFVTPSQVLGVVPYMLCYSFESAFCKAMAVHGSTQTMCACSPPDL